MFHVICVAKTVFVKHDLQLHLSKELSKHFKYYNNVLTTVILSLTAFSFLHTSLLRDRVAQLSKLLPPLQGHRLKTPRLFHISALCSK